MVTLSQIEIPRLLTFLNISNIFLAQMLHHTLVIFVFIINQLLIL